MYTASIYVVPLDMSPERVSVGEDERGIAGCTWCGRVDVLVVDAGIELCGACTASGQRFSVGVAEDRSAPPGGVQKGARGLTHTIDPSIGSAPIFCDDAQRSAAGR